MNYKTHPLYEKAEFKTDPNENKSPFLFLVCDVVKH